MAPFVIDNAHSNASYRLVETVTTHLFDVVPRSTGPMGPGGQIARRVYARLIARYQAIGVLLAMDLGDDALALTRGLLYDAERLQVMAKDPAQRDALGLAWHRLATKDVEDRAATAERLHGEGMWPGLRDIATRHRSDNERVRSVRGPTKLPLFPGEGRGLAQAAGHADDELDHVIASDPAHSTLVASLWHDRNGGPLDVLTGANNPAWTRLVADRATRHMVRAAAAMATVCELTCAGELSAYRDDIERRLDGRELPEAD